MNLYQLSIRNIAGSAFRSWVVGLCAFLVAGLTLATAMISRGAETSLNLAINRLGADILVVPEGTAEKVESALLMGHPTRVWMPQENLQKILRIPGVAAATPQIYLSTLSGASCCSVSDMFLVAYDPATDFTIKPWLQSRIGEDLHLGEVIGGRYVFTPAGEQNIQIYGYLVTLKTNMEPTGTALDQSMFMTMETAKDIALKSVTMAEEPLVIPQDEISAILVRVKQDAALDDIVLDIMHNVKGVMPIESPNLFQAYRQQLRGLQAGVVTVMSITLVMSVLVIGLVYSMAANERRRELGVLRAMGARRSFVFKTLLVEAGLLAFAGGITGTCITTITVILFRNFIISTVGIPFILPAPLPLAVQVMIGLGLTFISVILAAMLPAYRISRMDPAIAMRE